MNRIESLRRSQEELMQAISGRPDGQQGKSHVADGRGLAVYRRGLKANAARAIEISYPTIYQLLGEEFCAVAASDYLFENPFFEGDWGAWGGGFSDWLLLSEELAVYPYLRDSAALDWACHLCERATEKVLNVETLQLLATADPYRLKLIFGPGVSLIKSEYPIVDIWQAHRDNKQAQDKLALAREKMQLKIGQNAIVWRPAWKAEVRAVGHQEQYWLEQFMQQSSLGAALDRMQEDFSLEQWLPQAIAQKLIIGIEELT